MESAKTWNISTVLVLSCFSRESFISPWMSMLKPFVQKIKSNLSQQKLLKMVYGNIIISLPSLSFAPSALLYGHRNSHHQSGLFRYQNYFCSKYPLAQSGTCWYPVVIGQFYWPIRSNDGSQTTNPKSAACSHLSYLWHIIFCNAKFFCFLLLWHNVPEHIGFYDSSKVQTENIRIWYR